MSGDVGSGEARFTVWTAVFFSGGPGKVDGLFGLLSPVLIY